MCGIVAMIARNHIGFVHSDMDVMENLLVLDTLRGLDSTGVFAVDRTRNVGYMKVASHPYHLFACEDWGKFRTKTIQNGRIIVGHNRKATQGSINSANAHPFHENNIILVHNGTLRGDHKKLADTEVDSHAVCHAFNAQGAENVIPTINGAFAFVWWDIEKGRLFAIRNEERPLNLVMTQDLVVFASEAWMAEALLSRNGKKVLETMSLEPGLLYEFDTNGKYTTKKLELYKPEVTTYTNYQGSDHTKKTHGALTAIKNTATGGKNTAVDDIPSTPTPSQFPNNPSFPKGARIMGKITEWSLTQDGRGIRINGFVSEPDMPMIDFVANITVGQAGILNLPKRKDALLAGNVTMEILAYHESTCGPSIYVKDFKEETYVNTHLSNVPETVWRHVSTHCRCQHCNSNIMDDEAEFTSVSFRVDNTLRVTCGDCIEDKLTGEMKNEFAERRYAALQRSQPVGNQPVLGTANPTTLH